jgi:hypothetical protein
MLDPSFSQLIYRVLSSPAYAPIETLVPVTIELTRPSTYCTLSKTYYFWMTAT